MSRTDGYLKIKTKLDNSGIDKDVSELENKINKLETKNAEYSQEQSSLEKEIADYDKLKQKADEYKQKLTNLKEEKKTMFKANPSLAVTADTTEYANIKAQIGDMQVQYNKAIIELEKQAPAVDKVATKLEKVKAKQAENNTKIQQFKDKIESIRADKIVKQMNGVGNSIKKQLGRIAKMSLAIFGIRTAITAVRSAVNAVSQYNPQIATDLEYIKYVCANVLLPVVQKIISFVATLLGYVNAVMSAWFNINLFSNSSAKNFQKMQKNASGTAKSLKEAQKSLQSFDEKNVLQDNSSTASTETTTTTPSFDLKGEVPPWLQWIIDNKDLVLGIIAGIGAALVSMKVMGLDPILSLGIGITIAGVVKSVKAIINFIQNPSWANFVEVLEGISIAMVGIGVMVGVLTGNWIPLVIGLIALIVTEIIKHWDEVKNVLGAVGSWIYDHIIKPIGDFFTNLGNGIKDTFFSCIEWIKNVFCDVVNWINNKVIKPIGNFFTGLWNGIKNTFSSVWNWILGAFSKGGKIFNGIKDGVVNIFKTIVNSILKGINKVISIPFNTVNRLLNKIKGVDIFGLKPFDGFWGWNPLPVPKIPLLAKGGIVSSPTMAVIGEAGKEAVIPLENNLEYLDYLADKISSKIGGNGGYYIINLDGRTIQRGQAKRRQELAFAMNGR